MSLSTDVIFHHTNHHSKSSHHHVSFFEFHRRNVLWKKNDGAPIDKATMRRNAFLLSVVTLLSSLVAVQCFTILPPSLPPTCCRMLEQPQASDVVINKPKRAVKGVASRTGPLNEEVSRLANISLEEANELIKIGAVWARMETLTEQDLLSQYDEDFGGTVTATKEEEGLEEYVQRMEMQRYRRILTPSVVEGGTDIRVYPQPRRFPSCYELTEERLLHEDTTFIIVDKPPMLPTQVCTVAETNLAVFIVSTHTRLPLISRMLLITMNVVLDVSMTC
jgi:hypothetical protein